MRKRFLVLLRKHYRRYHDILFYVLALGVIVVSTWAALSITKTKNEQERENLRARAIPTQEFKVGEKPIYVGLQEAGLSNQEVAQIVGKLSAVVDTRKLQKKIFIPSL